MSPRKKCYRVAGISLFLVGLSTCAFSSTTTHAWNTEAGDVTLSEEQVAELLLEMQYAYASQRTMLKTMRLKARSITPQKRQAPDSRTCLTMDIKAFPVPKVLCHLDYSGNSQGHSLQRIQAFDMNQRENTCVHASPGISAHSLVFSFDGQQARVLCHGQGFVYNHIEQVPNVGHYDPRELMPHLFNPCVMEMLEHPEKVCVTQAASGMFLLTYREKRKLHQFFVSPKKDFMIVKLERISFSDQFPVTEREQGIRYSLSHRGFWYPTSSYTKVRERVTRLMRIDSFVLNPPAVSYTIGFTEETPVYRHQNPVPGLSFACQEQICVVHEPDMASVPQVIAGHILDANGSPVAGASVQICGDSHLADYDTVLWHCPRVDEQLLTCTDERGFFTLGLDAGKDYHMLIYDARYAPTLVRNVPLGTQDLSIRLAPGGMISGNVVCLHEDARKPVPHVEIRAVQIDPHPLPLARLDCDRIVRTDAQGHFKFDRLLVRMIDYKRGRTAHWDARSHLWEIACQESQMAIVLDGKNSTAELQLVVKPQDRRMFSKNILP